MAGPFQTKYRIKRGGRWLGSTDLFVYDDLITLDESTGTVSVTGSGFLARKMSGSKLIVSPFKLATAGVAIDAPSPAGTTTSVRYLFLARVDGTEPSRKLTIGGGYISNGSDDSAGEWEGDEEP